MKLTTGSESAGCLACFEDDNALAAASQVGRAEKAVVSCPDNDGVEAIQSFFRRLLSYAANTLAPVPSQSFPAYTSTAAPL